MDEIITPVKEKQKQKQEELTKLPKKYDVIMYNDDYTYEGFVIFLLTDIFGYALDKTHSIISNINEKGSVIAGTFTQDIAETKAASCMQLAKTYKFPLLVRALESRDG